MSTTVTVPANASSHSIDDRLSSAIQTVSRFASPAPTGNPYVEDVFEPVYEEVNAGELQVIGELPADLNGMLVRNGPNPLFPTGANYHLFDGDGMLHGVRLQDGRASYANRFVRTASLAREVSSGRSYGIGMRDGVRALTRLAVDTLANRGADISNKANTSVVWHNNKLLALWEAGLPHEIRPEASSTVGPYDFDRAWLHAVRAHPKVDAATSEMLLFGYTFLPSSIQYGVLSRNGQLLHSTSVRLPRAVMMHDFAITRNYTIFLDLPLTISAARPLLGRPMISYRPECGARFGILPRYAKGSGIKWFDVDPCYVFHVLNAFEQGDEVVVYGCRFPQAPRIMGPDKPARDRLQLDAVMYCWRFNRRTGEVHEGPIDDLPVEFPRVDDMLIGSDARYGYATSFSLERATLAKYDLDRHASQLHELGSGCVAGEGVFVEREDRRAEDEGYLLAFVHDKREERSELRVIDCRNFDGPPVARVLMPRRVPAGFHATWVPGTGLSRI